MYKYDYWKTTDPSDTYDNYLLTEKADSMQAEYDRIMDELTRKIDAMVQADDPNWSAADDLISSLSIDFEIALDCWDFDNALLALDDLYNAL